MAARLGSVGHESRPRNPTLYYLESYFAGCLLTNRIVTRVPFAGRRGGFASRADSSNSRYRSRRQRFKTFRGRTRQVHASLSALFPDASPGGSERAKGENGPQKEKQNDLEKEQAKKVTIARIILPSSSQLLRKLIPREEPRTCLTRADGSGIQSTISKLF